MQDSTTLIGITGRAGSGKDYLCESLGKMLTDRPVLRVALADEVRHELEEVLNDGERLPALWRKPYPKSVRWLLQQYGTEFRRAQDPEYWVNRTMERIAKARAIAPNAVIAITDVRFFNEAWVVRSLGGVVVEVRASDGVRASRLGGTLPPVHASEFIDFDVDFVVDNDVILKMPPELLTHLGLPPTCIPCRLVQPHTWHDPGKYLGSAAAS